MLLGDGGHAGYSVSTAGDVNGDGFDDVLVGDYSAAGSLGAAYLTFGPITGTVDLSSTDAVFEGEATGSWAGFSVSCAGDVNGDGYDDMLVGDPSEDTGGSNAGKGYLLYGKP